MTVHDPDPTHLRDRLDDSFGDGPPLVPAAGRLAAGKRALRRRRLTAAAGSAALAAVVLVAASFSFLGDNVTAERGADPLAPAPSVSTPTTGDIDEAQLEESLDRLAALAQVRDRAEQMREAAKLVSDRFPAALDLEGSLVVKEGWRVLRQVPEPVGYEAPEASLGVVVTDGERTRWMLLSVTRVVDSQGNPVGDELATGASADPAGKGYSRFEDWLASMVALSGGTQPDPLVVVDADDQVVAGPGSTLVDVQEIDVIEGYTSPGDRVAEVRRDGRTWFVVIRGHASEAELIPVDGNVLPEPTLAALLTYVGQQAESGEGVR